MAALLGELIAAGPTAMGELPLAHVARLADAFDGVTDTASPRSDAVGGLVVPLSARELEVLRLVATGKQNQEIADELYVSLNTVKKHVTHILDKLGATNRTSAAERARELNLLA
jgi:LuxR family maltose regulon positive regulatory protein